MEFDDVRLTSYAGLELLERYLRTRRFNQLVREAFADLPRGGDFGVVVMVRVFVGLVIVGGDTSAMERTSVAGRSALAGCCSSVLIENSPRTGR